MGLESQSAVNPCHKSHPIKADQPSIAWIKFITPSSSFGPSLECPVLESAQNLLNQPIKCFFDLLGSCFSNRPNWNMQWILECFVMLIIPPFFKRIRPRIVTVMLLIALQSTHILQVPSFLGTSSIGTAHGLMLSLTCPLVSNSLTCL